jgi:glucoamylase
LVGGGGFLLKQPRCNTFPVLQSFYTGTEGGLAMQFFQKHRRLLLFVALPILILLIISLLVLPRFINTAHTAGGPAPRGSWTTSSWAPSNNTILGTAPNTTSDVWFTGYNGIISEVFYPSADTPDTTALQFLVGDSNHTWVDEERVDTTSHAQLYDNHSLAWTVSNTAKNNKYQIKKIIYTDPARNSLIQQVTFTALTGTLSNYQLYVYYDPSIHDGGDTNSSSTQVHDGTTMLISTDKSGDYASALAASIPYQSGMTSSGFLGLNDGLTDLKGTSDCGSSTCPDYTMNWTYDSATEGNTVQTRLRIWYFSQ